MNGKGARLPAHNIPSCSLVVIRHDTNNRHSKYSAGQKQAGPPRNMPTRRASRGGLHWGATRRQRSGATARPDPFRAWFLFRHSPYPIAAGPPCQSLPPRFAESATRQPSTSLSAGWLNPPDQPFSQGECRTCSPDSASGNRATRPATIRNAGLCMRTDRGEGAAVTAEIDATGVGASPAPWARTVPAKPRGG
jgi:hypothetical protein